MLQLGPRAIAAVVSVLVLAMSSSTLQAQDSDPVSSPVPSATPPAATSPAVTDGAPRQVPSWGFAEFRGYFVGDEVAPNGQEFDALFRLDFEFDIWLCRAQRVYLFFDTEFWGQRAAPGVTNPKQGVFDFSKREFDLTTGVAWNYYGAFEARAFAYSFNNLNRGDSATLPIGYTDGVGLENRYYISPIYADLGTEAFNVSRATFVSVGFFPTKDMVDSGGVKFKPGPFARANLTFDLIGDQLYLFADSEFIATKSCTPRMLTIDAGVAFRPWAVPPFVEFRLGATEDLDLSGYNLESTVYGGVRIHY